MVKKIFLIGDSIRFGAPGSEGYGIFVKQKLEGKAEVYAPDENCRFAQYTLRYLHEWCDGIPKEDIDVVHWNNGLWDVLRLLGDEPLTDVETYGVMLKRVYHRIKYLFPKAKIIFALSTAVVEEWQKPDFFRYNKEIEQYNNAAKEIMCELGVQVNDLYSLSKSFDNSLHSDFVHFGTEGSILLANKVISECLKVLDENDESNAKNFK